jgi:hypothetical protein
VAEKRIFGVLSVRILDSDVRADRGLGFLDPALPEGSQRYNVRLAIGVLRSRNSVSMSQKSEAMIEDIRTSWRIFAGGRPGLRFRERYRLRQSRGRGTFHPARLSYLVVGTALIAISALFGWLPVLGWGTAFVGLGMIAGEFYLVARLMDRLEAKIRILFGPLGKKLAGLPAWTQATVSLTVALVTFALMYGLYSLTFSG